MLGKKILTICEWGNSRSVGLAFMLKQKNYDALAVGICAAAPETFDMLCNWADNIIVTFAPITPFIPEKYKDKVLTWDVGFDRYFIPPVNELITQYDKYFNEYINL